MQKTYLINRIIGIAGLIITLLIVLNYLQVITYLVEFSEKYLSHDHQVKPNTILLIKIFLSMCILLIATSSILFLLNLAKKVSQTIINFLQINDPITSSICSKKYLDLYILVIGTAIGIFQVYYFLQFGEPLGDSARPTSEGLLETIFSLLLLFSIIFLIYSIRLIKGKLFAPKPRRRMLYLLFGISVILILIFGEEISWGQRIFNWESSGIFTEYNYQNETNFHNFFNPYTEYYYPIAGVGFFTFLLVVWLFPKKRINYFFNLIFPHPSLFFLVSILALSSFFGGGHETFEQIFAIFTFLYCYRLFMCLRYPTLDLSNI
ncbi:MAG: hypothetical protein GWP19_04155 [Planctomycetia bacterium]|nr:hypothetical protein [Planctomycetia bacterium]